MEYSKRELSKTRIFPTNLYNMRENILLTTNREGYQENLATDEYQFPEGYQRGVGVDQTETLPLWMISEFNGWGKQFRWFTLIKVTEKLF